MGLAPVVVDVIFEALRVLVTQGIALLLVEQYVQRALAMADTVYLMKKGEVSLAGNPAGLDQSTLMAEYLGRRPDPPLPDQLPERPPQRHGRKVPGRPRAAGPEPRGPGKG
jgi:ABC-type multidrug transport system ATPase subunit